MYEYYFAYNHAGFNAHDESFLSTTSIDDIQKQVLKSLKQINEFVDEHLKPISNRSNYRFCLKIEYNQVETPSSYQPTGFVDSRDIDSPINWKQILTTKMSSTRKILAQIKTTFHKMLIVYRVPTMRK